MKSRLFTHLQHFKNLFQKNLLIFLVVPILVILGSSIIVNFTPLAQKATAQKANTKVFPNSADNQSYSAIFGNTKIFAGSTTPGATNWKSYSNNAAPPGIEAGIYVDVDTSEAGFTSTPKYVISLGGLGYHWRVTGASSVYRTTPTNFSVYIRFSETDVTTLYPTLTPEFANTQQFHINWIAVGK
ncbi:hypothetical protein H6G96_38415 [Nostoc sp. FACHB-892]|uniref:hypothetical protein n=1 Tax=Nostoc sp. FACHB-892 TaxID=2692843 RepID=UPI001685794F|nr:hypothetical protein [Nostoc sp. FACHB-892]MBD2731981.1 hypothetical protein [Nostoc sp. FACHB-892]